MLECDGLQLPVPSVEAMTTLTWGAVTTNCDGSVADDLALYAIHASFDAAMMEVVATVPAGTHSVVLPVTPLPGEVLYVRVHVVDWAGNSSEAGCPS